MCRAIRTPASDGAKMSTLVRSATVFFFGSPNLSPLPSITARAVTSALSLSQP